ncbi:MAG: carboxypeptidase-like regulatory domain-containing protein [Lewinella sp.]|nr:carboxypeptidase-like regulatory domain-containing protein [Lewinella sp.]
MYDHKYLLLLLVLCSSKILLSAQTELSGIVLDSTDRQPVPFATVYFDGTTRGQTTDEQGHFTLPLTGMERPATLVVSHVNYAPLSLVVDDQTASPLELTLRPANRTISTVLVQDHNRRQKNLEEFRPLFLGSDDWGQRAQIQNEEAIVFARDYVQQRLEVKNDYIKRMLVQADRTNMQWAPDGSYVLFDKAVNLQATANVPLLIKLPDLGYTLQLDLVHFQTDYEVGRTGSLGYYFFQPEEGFDGKTRARHRRNRERAYYNSPQHLLRALYAGDPANSGYRIMEPPADENGSPQDVDLSAHLQVTGPDEKVITGLQGHHLIVLYYGDRKGRPLPPARWKRVHPTQSGLFFGADNCPIRADGTMGDSGLYFSGSLGGRGVARALPSDFVPSKQ